MIGYLSNILSNTEAAGMTKATNTRRVSSPSSPSSSEVTKAYSLKKRQKSQTSIGNVEEDLQDLNTLARRHCWAAIEELAAQVDCSYHSTFTPAGNAPLHSAISHGAPFSTIQALVIASPPSVALRNNFGNLPLHFVAWKNKFVDSFTICEFLLAYHPQSVQAINDHGNLPLHHATNYKAHPDIVQLLWRAYPRAVHMKNHKGQTPLDNARHRLGKNHAVVTMLEGSTARNYVFEGVPCRPAVSVSASASASTSVVNSNDGSSRGIINFDPSNKISTTATPTILATDTWQEIDLTS